MKKVFLAFAFIATLLVTSCNKKVETTETNTTTDTVTVQVDSVQVDTVTVDTLK